MRTHEPAMRDRRYRSGVRATRPMLSFSNSRLVHSPPSFFSRPLGAVDPLAGRDPYKGHIVTRLVGLTGKIAPRECQGSERRCGNRADSLDNHHKGVCDTGSFVGDGGAGASCCNARPLQSISSESIMAGRRAFISLSTSHVSTGIWLTSASIV